MCVWERGDRGSCGGQVMLGHLTGSRSTSKAGILGPSGASFRMSESGWQERVNGPPRLMSGMLSSLDVVLSQNTPPRGCSYMQGHLSGWQRGKARLCMLSCHLWLGSSWPWTSSWYESPGTQRQHKTGVKTGKSSFFKCHC